MKKRLTIVISAVIGFMLIGILCLLCYASGEDETVIIASGDTEWDYRLLTTDEFKSYPSPWQSPDYSPTRNWHKGKTPMGDRIAPDNGSGWVGEYHVILLRKTFRIDDLNAAKKASYWMNVFYDNTMTVYLNGQQVFYDQGWVDSYVDIDLKNFGSYLVKGTNTLAISVCDDVGGREFDLALMSGKRAGVTPDPSLEVSDAELRATGLSTVYLTTDDGDYIRSRLNYVDASMRIALSSGDAAYTSAYTADDGGRLRIKGRGNSTWSNGYPDGKPNTLGGDTHTRKAPYTLKLDSKANLFGLGKSKHWVLIANYMDRTNLRNKLIYDLSGRMGMVYCKSVFVNLVLNGEYMGTYALTQKIDPELFNGQVVDYEDAAEDFAKNVARKFGYSEDWQSDFEDELTADWTWLTSSSYKGYKVADYVDLSKYPTNSGYLIEYDGYEDEDSFFRTNHGVPLKVSNLEQIKTNSQMFRFVRDFFNDFEEACYSEDFYNSKGKHYSEYVDMDSLVDYYILNAVILNVEFGYKSMYLFINEDQKLVLGPCWDYDWSSGNPFLGANGQYDQWYNDGRAANNKWYRKLYGDPYFVSLVRERWNELSDALDDMVDSIDYYRGKLSPAAELEYRKFSSDSFERDFAGRTGGRSFADECNQLKEFLKNRIRWMDEQFAKRDPNIEGLGLKTSNWVVLGLNGSLIQSAETAFDYSLSGKNGTLNLTVQMTRTCTAKVYVNGILTTTRSIPKNQTATIALSPKELRDGVNVITVRIYLSGELYATTYLSAAAPRNADPPKLGSYVHGYQSGSEKPPIPNPPQTKPPQTESTNRPSTTARPQLTEPVQTTVLPPKTTELPTPPTSTGQPGTKPPQTTTIPKASDQSGNSSPGVVSSDGTDPDIRTTGPTQSGEGQLPGEKTPESRTNTALWIALAVVAVAVGATAIIIVGKKHKH